MVKHLSRLHFYMDDSGTRNPDKKQGTTATHRRDWFALGGILVREEDEEEARTLHSAFCKRWNLLHPLHSAEIRNRSLNYAWLDKLDEAKCRQFYEELYGLMKSAPVTGLACVIDGTGYNARYGEKYKGQRWLLCKTAFSIVVERAVKIARMDERKLRVLPERCNKREDRTLKAYYETLRTEGLPFEAGASAKYTPLGAAQFKDTLYEFDLKFKSSPLAQLADLYLWPMCMGGYNKQNRPYARLLEDGKLIECQLPEEVRGTHGTKYSCFDLQT